MPNVSSTSIRIPLASGRSRKIPLPEMDELDDAVHSWAVAASIIEVEWRARHSQSSSERQAWLRRVAYELLSHFFDNGFQNVIDQHLVAKGLYKRGVKPSSNPFQRGLLAIFGHDARGQQPKTRRAASVQASRDEMPTHYQRMLIGKQLWHAYRHFVPTALLEGFVLQVGTRGINQRSDANEIEPGFSEWIADSIADRGDTGLRGEYSSTILSLVRKRFDRREQWDREVCRTENAEAYGGSIEGDPADWDD